MDDVILQLYTVSILGLFSYTHTEILWKGLDIYLSRKDGPIIAIHVEKEKFKAFGFKECKRINLGVSLMGLEEFTDHFNLMSRDYTNYNVLTANCRHLSIDVLTILEPVNATYAIMMLKKMNYKLSVTMRQWSSRHHCDAPLMRSVWHSIHHAGLVQLSYLDLL